MVVYLSIYAIVYGLRFVQIEWLKISSMASLMLRCFLCLRRFYYYYYYITVIVAAVAAVAAILVIIIIIIVIICTILSFNKISCIVSHSRSCSSCCSLSLSLYLVPALVSSSFEPFISKYMKIIVTLYSFINDTSWRHTYEHAHTHSYSVFANIAKDSL